MPHIPRYAPSLGYGSRPGVLAQRPAAAAAAPAPAATQHFGIDTISLTKWDVPADAMYKKLFGKDATYDAVQSLVHTPTAATAAAPAGPGRAAGSHG